MAAPEVLVIGDANPDLVLTGDVDPRFGQVEKLVDTASLVLGASGAIVAAGLARLGVPTALAAVVGDDVFGRFVLDELTACGVDTSWVRTDPDVASPVTVVLSAGDRAILTYPGTLATTGPEVVDADLLTRVRHVHSASMFLTPKLAPHLPDIFRRAEDRRRDDARWTPTGIRPNAGPARWPLLEHTDVLLPNAAELLALTGHARPRRRGARRRRHGLFGGAEERCRRRGPLDGRREHHGAGTGRSTAVDTTGAGDSFDAGFISAMFEGLDRSAIAFGVRCCAAACRPGLSAGRRRSRPETN